MYLGIHLKKNSKTKTGKKKKEKKNEERRNEQGSNPAPTVRCELYLTTTPLKLTDVYSAKGFLFNAFSTENPPANAVKDDRAA